MPPDPKPVRQKRKRPSASARLLAAGAATEWHDKTVAFGCKVCRWLGRECEGVVQAHHVLRSQFIRDYIEEQVLLGRLSRLECEHLERTLLWDLRNGLAVCYRTHRRHHNRIEPIPRQFVPQAAWEFAEEIGLARRLEADYPA